MPKHNDGISSFYNEHPTLSIFEKILPFIISHVDLVRVRETYRKVITESINEKIDYYGLKLRELVGKACPVETEAIPLTKDLNFLTTCDQILATYIELVSPSYVRVFVARSDLH